MAGAAQFDAVARISVDLRGFREASNQVTRSGGEMERAFKNLHKVLNQVEIAEKKTAAEISRTLRLYTQAANAVRTFATALQSLSKNEQSVQKGAKLMEAAFGQLRSALSSVQGTSQKEADRLARTLALYERQANVIKQLASAYQAMAAVTQGATRAEQAASRERQRAEETARKLAQAEDRNRIARQNAATAARNAAASEARAQAQLLRLQNELTVARQRDVAAANRSAQANQNVARSLTQATSATFGLRSALTDLEGVYRQTIQAIIAVGSAAISTAISHEAAFAQVARVTEETGGALETLRREAAQLTAELPVGFEELARAMQLASQTGIANDQLIEFTRTVVNFSVTTGIATEQVTLLFGRIQTMRNIPISQMDNFASAVLALGVSSAATEDEILKITESIATVTDLFGLSTQATLGLSSALATLRVRPELSRGALTRIFRELTDSVGEGGERLRTLSKIMGQTELDLVDLLRTNPDQFFLDFVKGLGSTTTEAGALQRTLRSLNINAVRDIDTISRLANNYDVLAEHVATSRIEFELGNKLQKQAGVILDTTRQRIDNLVDAFGTFLASAGEPFLEIIGDIASGLKTVVEALASAPTGVKVFGALIGIILAVGAAFAAYRLAVTVAMRATLAFQEAQSRGGVGTASLLTAYRGLRDVLREYIASAVGASRATTQLATSQEAATASASAMRTAQATLATSTAAVAASQGAAAASSQRLATSLTAISANTARNLGALNSTSAITASLANNQREAAVMAQRLGAAQSIVTSSAAGQAAAVRNTATNVRNLGVSMTGLANVTTAYGSALVGTFRTQQDMARTAQQSAAASTANAAALSGATVAANGFARAGAFVQRNWLPLLLLTVTLAPLVSSLAVGFANADSAAEEAGKKAFEAAGGFSELSRAIAEDNKQGAAAGPVFASVSASLDDLSESQVEQATQTRDTANLLKTYTSVLGTISTSSTSAEVAARRHGETLNNSNVVIERADKTLENFNQGLRENTFELRDNARAFIENTLRSAVMGTEIAKTKDEIAALQKESSLLQRVFKTVFEAPVNGESGIARASKQLKVRIDELTESIEENERKIALQQAARSHGGGRTKFEESLINENAALSDQRKVLQNTEAALAKIRGDLDRAAISSLLFGDSAKTGAQDANGALGDTADAADELGEAMQALSKGAQELATAYGQLIDPTEAWKNANDDASNSVENFTKNLQDQVTAAQNFARNLAILSSQGFSALVEQLKAMGPEGAKAAQELVDGSRDQLNKLEGVARQAGEAYKNALTTTLDVVAGMKDLGTENAKALTEAIVQQLNTTTTAGGDIAAARDRILAALQLINKEKIAPQVIIDILKAQGDIGKIQKIIQSAEKSGALDAKGSATLTTLLYTQALSQLQAGVSQLEAGAKLDANGKAKLTTEQYNKQLEDLRKSVATSILSGVLDPKGRAALDPKQFQTALDTLSKLVLTTEEQKKLNPDGSANLNPTQFNTLLEALKKRVADAERGGGLDPTGKADITGMSNFDRKLLQLDQASFRTGQQIKRNLTQTATVSVGYLYFQKNTPPPTPKTINAATGGWIYGPGSGTSDSIPAMLSNGEFVIRAKKAKEFAALLNAINSGRLKKGDLPGFATGGSVNIKRAAISMSGSSAQDSLIRSLPSSAFVPRTVRVAANGPQITVNNNYPQAEPTSTTINRALAYAATIGGTL